MARTTDEKVNTVIMQNTYWFQSCDFDQKSEAEITSLKETLLVLRIQVQNEGLSKKLLDDLILEKENGFKALLALTGFSNETFKRLITFIRINKDKELAKLTFRDQWIDNASSDISSIREWSDTKIKTKIQENYYFRQAIVNLFFEGSTVPVLSKTLPLFELKKLSICKLNFEIDAMIDTLIRYKEKGSYSGKEQRNAEKVIQRLLEKEEIDFEKSVDLEKLRELNPNEKRTMDFIIPNRKEPQVIIESSYLTTTSSGQGDKAKTEIAIKALISKHYPDARFWGFIDGIGWYVRYKDLKRLVEAFEDVFTYEESELIRFRDSLIAVIK